MDARNLHEMGDNSEIVFAKEYWTGDSRDGHLVNGDGYHYYEITKKGMIIDAYEYYEKEDGTMVVSPLPEMLNVHWIKDLGFEDLEVLDLIDESEYERIKDQIARISS